MPKHIIEKDFINYHDVITIITNLRGGRMSGEVNIDSFISKFRTELRELKKDKNYEDLKKKIIQEVL